MTYWIYENWRAHGHKAVIHDGSCGFCNEGSGRAGGTDPKNGRWHGPFNGVDGARNFAATLGSTRTWEHTCT